MSLALDILSGLLMLTGAFFAITGGIGLLRMPDFFTRLHAASLPDTLGMLGLLGGLVVQAINGAHWMSMIKLSLIAVFILFTGPVSTHALVRAALDHGEKPLLHDDRTHGRAPAGRQAGKASGKGKRGRK